MSLAVRVSIVTHRSAATIGACLGSVLAEGIAPRQVSVADNASTDETVAVVRRDFPDVELHELRSNRGFGTAQNVLLAASHEPLVLVLNPDAWLVPGAVARLASALSMDAEVALVAPRVERPDGTPELSFGEFPGPWRDWRRRRATAALGRGDRRARAHLERSLAAAFRPDWVSGVCFLARRDDLARVGGFDERFFLYLEDVDLCRRLRTLGRRAAVAPEARCVHLGGASFADLGQARREHRRARLLYERKHGSRFSAFVRGLARRRP